MALHNYSYESIVNLIHKKSPSPFGAGLLSQNMYATILFYAEYQPKPDLQIPDLTVQHEIEILPFQ